jgi:tetratricopeptide (TPR) repeat protein
VFIFRNLPSQLKVPYLKNPIKFSLIMKKTFLILIFCLFVSACSFGATDESAQGSSDTGDLYEQAMENLDQQKFSEAIELFSKYIEQNPKSADAYFNRGGTYGRMGMTAESIADFSQVILLEPEAGDAYFNRAIAYGMQGKYADAITDYNMALELNPRAYTVFLNRGLAFKNLGLFEDALKDFEFSIKAVDTDPRPYGAAAQIYELQEDSENAEKKHRKAAELGLKESQTWMEKKNLPYEKPEKEFTPQGNSAPQEVELNL